MADDTAERAGLLTRRSKEGRRGKALAVIGIAVGAPLASGVGVADSRVVVDVVHDTGVTGDGGHVALECLPVTHIQRLLMHDGATAVDDRPSSGRHLRRHGGTSLHRYASEFDLGRRAHMRGWPPRPAASASGDRRPRAAVTRPPHRSAGGGRSGRRPRADGARSEGRAAVRRRWVGSLALGVCDRPYAAVTRPPPPRYRTSG